MPDPITALKLGGAAIDLTGKAIGGLQRIMPWILVQPEAAAAELASIMTEIMKAPQVINQAVDALFAVIDDEKPRLAALAQIGDGSLSREVEAKRPHCHEIERIAARHLWQWLNKANGPDVNELRNFLGSLQQADGDLFYGLSEFARGVEAIASEAADLAMQHRPQDALTVLSNAAPELFATRKEANALALQLTEMQTQFRRRALGLPPE
jgi:hypothetical protein